MDIVKEIGMPAALGQLAEEAAELAQAALKMQRILMGTNPTPVTLEEAKANLREEAVDVDLCLSVISETDADIRFDAALSSKKQTRWEQRIREATAGHAEENVGARCGQKGPAAYCPRCGDTVIRWDAETDVSSCRCGWSSDGDWEDSDE